MIQIATFKWGHRYKADNVVRLHSMLSRNLTIPWEFVLISDAPEDVALTGRGNPLGPRSRYAPLWHEGRNLPGCGVRLPAFHRSMGQVIGQRFAWIDMDVVITGNVDHLFARPEPVILLKTPRPPLPYNGSFVLMDAGAAERVYSKWTADAYRGSAATWAARGVAGGPSDEKWIASVLGPEVPTIGGAPGADGVYYFRRHLMEGLGMRHRPDPAKLPEDARLVLFNGAHKPWSGVSQRAAPWVLDFYR